ncbi:beta-ketoacyl-ACP synthase III [Aliarcobacter trophiarum]|uniref:3-oxoacyl-[acp] synthase III n=1 Tax=Aliarcobacter trophiarum LMG 25534 TaxID=1032241 RepID=A0AAD0QLU9_9BACT|nr:beta-ketoacyl-ACP synthase III [Aliarcobacter trophiarum]AXK49055.1 3-oxoacyl-[acp] synthase III [Aliarcobacter trophiarum LMG 25534]
MNDVFINKIEKFMPNEPVFNDEIEDYLGYIGGKKSKARKIVLKSNGIKRRFYVLEKDTQKQLFLNSQLCAKAINKLEDKDFRLENLEVLACGTTSPDQLMPGHSLMVQGELKLKPIETISASGICLSGVNALKYIYLGIKSGEFKNGISTGSEASSPILSAKNFQEESKNLEELELNPNIAFEKDFLRWMLSDGAGAMLLEDKPNKHSISLKIEFIDILSYAGEMEVCMYSGLEVKEDKNIRAWRDFEQKELMEKSILSVQQNVKLLNENIVKYTVVKPLKEIIKKRALKASLYNYFLPHYSSLYFRDKLYEGLKEADFEIPYEKWFTNLENFGNTGSASIYIILEELFNSKKLKKGEKILCYIPESGRFSTAFFSLEVV